jgi:CRISPR-associated protein Cmr2
MEYYLSFSLSPVQEFVSAARTTRDLWTGSYLLSWLTGHALSHVLNASADKKGNSLILPAISQENPLLRAIAGQQLGEKDADVALTPTIPNTFIAVIDRPEIANDCQLAVKAEWERICGSVGDYLCEQLNKKAGKWDEFWSEQVKNYWSIQTVVVPVEEAESQIRFVPGNIDSFQRGLRYLARLSAAKKQVRHFPLHEIYRLDTRGLVEDTRPKCAMFGSMAQMGPLANRGESQMELSRDFWDKATELTQIGEARLQKKDRLCAVGLVKRFAWACYFKQKFNGVEFPFPDIDTISAAQWLSDAEIDPESIRQNTGTWSGHWLRWKSRNEGDDEKRLDGIEPCPSIELFEKIKSARQPTSVGPVPRYYSALMLDGDKMGETINRCSNAKELRQVSSELSRFATQQVKQLIEGSKGKLVYAGGDDVLALLPAEHALDCTLSLKETFQNLEFPHRESHPPACTVALVIAHYKAPLHIILAELRAAEKTAKAAGGNRLAVTVMRRSGEKTTNTIDWGQTKKLGEFVGWFKGKPVSTSNDDSSERQAARQTGETDRWVYRFRQVLSDMPDDTAALSNELARLLSRAELQEKESRKRKLEFEQFHADCQDVPTGEDKNNEELKQTPKDKSLRFAQLIQSASFIARNGEE